MGGFLGTHTPVWDISTLYKGDERQDMLVNTVEFGAGLAESFGVKGGTTDPERTVILQKRHVYTTHGKDIATDCYRAVYTLINAEIQTHAATLQAAAKASGTVDTAEVTGLADRYARDCQVMTEATQDKSWRLWSREVEASPLYRNSVYCSDCPQLERS